MKNIVIINEQHSLMKDQERVLKNLDGEVITVNVPARGWTKKQMDEEILSILEKLGWKIKKYKERVSLTATSKKTGRVIFVSPIPYMMLRLRDHSLFGDHQGGLMECFEVKAFHNDRREKKEVPNGDGGTRIINTVAKDGWELV